MKNVDTKTEVTLYLFASEQEMFAHEKAKHKGIGQKELQELEVAVHERWADATTGADKSAYVVAAETVTRKKEAAFKFLGMEFGRKSVVIASSKEYAPVASTMTKEEAEAAAKEIHIAQREYPDFNIAQLGAMMAAADYLKEYSPSDHARYEGTTAAYVINQEMIEKAHKEQSVIAINEAPLIKRVSQLSLPPAA